MSLKKIQITFSHFFSNFKQNIAEDVGLFEVLSYEDFSEFANSLGKFCTLSFASNFCRYVIERIFGPFAPHSYYNVNPHVFRHLLHHFLNMFQILYRIYWSILPLSTRAALVICSFFIIFNFVNRVTHISSLYEMVEHAYHSKTMQIIKCKLFTLREACTASSHFFFAS